MQAPDRMIAVVLSCRTPTPKSCAWLALISYQEAQTQETRWSLLSS